MYFGYWFSPFFFFFGVKCNPQVSNHAVQFVTAWQQGTLDTKQALGEASRAISSQFLTPGAFPPGTAPSKDSLKAFESAVA